jgi:hypothetical protein
VPLTSIVSWERNRWTSRAQLQVNQAAPDPGKWAAVEGLYPAVVTIGGVFTGLQLNILYANTEQPPADSDVNWPIWGAQLTSVGGLIIDAPIRYIKAQVVAIASGAVNAGFQAAARS